MRRFLPFGLLLLIACGSEESKNDPRSEKPHEGGFKTEFRAIWQKASDYTLEVLDRMPKKKWKLAPAEGSMSFRQQALHLEGNLHRLTDRYILDQAEHKAPKPDSSIDKKEMKERLTEAFDKVENALERTSSRELRDSTRLFERMKVPKSRVFLLMRDHMTHHRAQMIIALRKAGQAPPDYRGW